MKFTSICILTTLISTASSFLVAHRPSTSTITCHAAKLDGRKIKGDVVPLNNFILVKKAPAQDKTEGGILLTGKAKIVKTEGTVQAVGPGKTHQDSGITVQMPVKTGESVVYGKFDGTEIDLDGQPHTLIRDDDVLVKFHGDQLTLESVDVVFDNVLVAVDSSESATEGGILLAKSSSQTKRASTGEVVKVGPGKMASNGELMTMDVAPGDMVKFRDFAGNEVEIEGKEYSVVKMVDILAKY
ncbi:chaperonin GroES [Fistulifera solaris]|uniref:20 kDa chaperonin, chloroplastic n=1 Tax=Fistulifera solaris TaxID=1519565 RepID=A0A1Z5JXD3_FISSO|nr:chaperonin GroES [Fistulifera solaris]|eukprot:GAX18559.1 chaperonin GroES [Fistulifera solaris]